MNMLSEKKKRERERHIPRKNKSLGLHPNGRPIYPDDKYFPLEEMEEYALSVSSQPPNNQILQNVRQEIAVAFPASAHMMIDELQRSFVCFFMRSIGASEVLELGCFGGYSSLSLASSLPLNGTLTTCDINEKVFEFATKQFAKYEIGKKISAHLKDAFELLKELKQQNDVQPNSCVYDIIFVDANKKKNRTYYDYILENKLLKKGGIIIFDNTLFKNRVIAVRKELHDSREKISRSIEEFNLYVANDPRTEKVMVPLWDGLTMIRCID